MLAQKVLLGGLALMLSFNGGEFARPVNAAPPPTTAPSTPTINTITLTASQDNTLYESATGALSNGAGQYFFAGHTNQDVGASLRRGLVQFDVAGALPANATILSVTVFLSLTRTSSNSPQSIHLHRALNAWGEGTSNADNNEGRGADATPGDATWLHRVYTSTVWATAGGDFDPTASATTTVIDLGQYAWSSPALLADVLAWQATPASNAGWVVVGNESTPQTAERFATRESTDVTARPQLLITYTVPVPIAATLVAQEGQAASNLGTAETITNLNSPFTNGTGRVGFTGQLSSGENFVWYDTGMALRSSQITSYTLTLAENTLGIGDHGEFFYSPNINGNDGVWSQTGYVLADGDIFPGTTTSTVTFNSRPQMLPNGRAYWIAGINPNGGTNTLGRGFLTSPNATSNTITTLFKSGDVISGFVLQSGGSTGVGFDFQVSDNNQHHIHELIMNTGSTVNDDFLYVDGTLIAREDDPTGQGDNWDNWGTPSINNAGNYLFSGDTNGATATDQFIAYNGQIVLREGSTLAGISLTTPAFVQGLSLNNLNQAAFIWGVSTAPTRTLFIACDASQLVTTTQVLLAIGNPVDLTGDNNPDATVSDLPIEIGPALQLAEDGAVFVQAALDYGSGPLQAILKLASPCNIPPTAAPDMYMTLQATPLSVAAPGVLDNDSDVNVQPLTAQLDTPPANGALALAADGSFVYTPTVNFVGLDTFTYSAFDGQAASPTATVSISVAARPAAQWLTADQTVTETTSWVTVTLELSTTSPFTASVPYTVTGTATPGADYDLSDGTLVVPPNTLSTTLVFSLTNDTVFEPNETIIITLGAPTNATLGAVTQHVVTVVSEDAWRVWGPFIGR